MARALRLPEVVDVEFVRSIKIDYGAKKFKMYPFEEMVTNRAC